MTIRRPIFKPILIGIGLMAIVGCSTNSTTSDIVPVKPPQFIDATVHDPSVIKVDDTYYVFGSHLMSAKSKDLIAWTQVSDGVSAGNKLIPDPFNELKETFDWAQAGTLWAPDVIRLPDGKYYMYYNACRGDSPRSALGIAVSNDPEGPYSNLGIILKSGMDASEPLADGTIYDATVHPNTVDPAVFFDNDGKLWMVYGSYSGGIYILRMDSATGKPEPGQGYGKKLLGGNHARIEGPYMLYSKETKYYYLFLSYGGLGADGGYNMRVVRSTQPDGPFLDAAGHDMIEAKGAPFTVFDDDSIAPYGVKLMGNFQWKTEDGDDGIGYVSPGHNSAIYDKDSGKYYLIFHTRFPNMGEMHHIRVHQMFMNQDGWPVIAPHRYAGETISQYDKKDIIGDYMLINHGKDISADMKRPVTIKLDKNGLIAGAGISGTWKIEQGHDAELAFNGVLFHGVFLRQWDEDAGRFAMTFSVMSGDGTAAWGSRASIENGRAEQ